MKDYSGDEVATLFAHYIATVHGGMLTIDNPVNVPPRSLVFTWDERRKELMLTTKELGNGAKAN